MDKKVFYFFMFFISLNSYTQIKDTIRLDQLKVIATNKKAKHFKTKGLHSSLTGNNIKSIISKMDEIPSGNLSSIKFFFNSSVLFFIKDNDNLRNENNVPFHLIEGTKTNLQWKKLMRHLNSRANK